MKVRISGYEAGPPGSRFMVLTTQCPFNRVWVEDRKAGSIACSECEYFSGISEAFVYCLRGDKRHRKDDKDGV